MNQALKHLLQLSSHGKQFNVSKLSSNIIEFIKNLQIYNPSTTIMQENISITSELLVRKCFTQIYTDNGQEEQLKGRMYSFDGGRYIFEVKIPVHNLVTNISFQLRYKHALTGMVGYNI